MHITCYIRFGLVVDVLQFANDTMIISTGNNIASLECNAFLSTESIAQYYHKLGMALNIDLSISIQICCISFSSSHVNAAGFNMFIG